MTPTLDQVLALADEARRSPHARRVLHDALLERYGDDFGRVVERAGSMALAYNLPMVVTLRPSELRYVEGLWSGAKLPTHVLENRGAFEVYELARLREHWPPGHRRYVTLVVVARPPQRTA